MLQELPLHDVRNVTWAGNIKPGEWVRHHLDSSSKGLVVGVKEVDVMVLWSIMPDKSVIARVIQDKANRKLLAQDAARNYAGRSMDESMRAIANLVASDKIDPLDLVFDGSPIVDVRIDRKFNDWSRGWTTETSTHDVIEFIMVYQQPSSNARMIARFEIDMMNGYVHGGDFQIEDRWSSSR